MSAPVDTTVAMTEPADSTAAVTAETAVPELQGSVPPGLLRAAQVSGGTVSPNVVIGVLGGLIAALLSAMMVLLVWQFGLLADNIASLSTRIEDQGSRIDGLSTRIDNQGARIDNQGARIDSLGVELRAEIGMLRADMQAGFRSVNETLLDHTDRLARLEASVVNLNAEF